MFSHYFNRIKGNLTNGGEKTPLQKKSVRQRFRPQLEKLEDRAVPATFTVNTSGDLPDVIPGDGFALDQNGNTSLRAAIEEGNLENDGVIIEFDSAIGGVTLQDALPSLNNNFTITGVGNPFDNNTYVMVDPQVSGVRIFRVNSGFAVNINNLYLGGGQADNGQGGAIYNAGTLNLYQVSVSGNTASQAGGGIYNAADASLTLEDCVVNSNGSLLDGGGIANYGQAWVQNTSIFDNEAISNNMWGLGGGIFNAQSATLLVSDNSEIYSNRADLAGGGVHNLGIFEMTGGIIYQNDVRSQIGGGGGVCSVGTTTMIGVDITYNTCNGNNAKGGGLEIVSGTTTLISCTISNNSCLTGNGAYVKANVTFDTSNCTITDDVVYE